MQDGRMSFDYPWGKALVESAKGDISDSPNSRTVFRALRGDKRRRTDMKTYKSVSFLIMWSMPIYISETIMHANTTDPAVCVQSDLNQ